MTTYTSDEILAQEELYDIQERGGSFGEPIRYRMTPGELGWLDFVRGRYSIADYIDANLEDDVLTIDAYEISRAMDDDDCPYVPVCLDDSTALAKLCFWLYMEPYEED